MAKVLREGDAGFEYKVGHFYGRGGCGADAAVAEPEAKPAEPAAKEPAADPGKGAQPDLKVIDGGKGADQKAVDDAGTRWPDKGFPPNWAERMVDLQGLQGEDRTKEVERLSKQSSLAEVGKSNREASRKIQQLAEDLKARVKIPQGKEDHPDDVKAFNRAWGVPDSVDEAIKVLPTRPKELGERPPADIEAIRTVLPVLQAKQFNKDQITTVFALMDQAQLNAEKHVAQVSKLWDKESEETLRQEWNQKGQFSRELEVSNRAAEALFGDFMNKGERQEFFNLTLDNGRKIGSYPNIVKAFNRLGREGLDAVDTDNSPEAGETSDGPGVEAQIATLKKMAHSGKPEDEERYRSKEVQDKLMSLMSRKVRLDGKKK